MDEVWEYLDRAYLSMYAFLYDLMKLIRAARDITDKNVSYSQRNKQCKLRTTYLDAKCHYMFWGE